MFDITSSKLLILGIVALLVIGPKDLPALLRTIGKYVGIIKRQAAEFRAQFDEAMRDSELADLKRDVESLGREAEQTMRAAEQSVEKDLTQAQESVNAALDAGAAAPSTESAPAQAAEQADAAATPNVADAAPTPSVADASSQSALNGAGSHAVTETGVEGGAEAQHPARPEVEKSGA
jgi:sec-independent protein translocase protein TatB